MVGVTRPVFYYDFNSPYAYLAAMRIEDVLPDAEWRPISFGHVLRTTGRRPWSFEEDREADFGEIDRRARERGLAPLRYAEGWPIERYSLAPLRAAVVAEERGRLREYSRAVYALVFGEPMPLGDPELVRRAAEAVGLDPAEVEEAIGRADVKDRVRAATDEAIERGVEGIPTIAVGDELYWGDDRLEEAAAAAAAA